MITVKRETDIGIIDVLKPYFVGDGSYTPDVIANELRARMAIDNNSVCIVVGYARDIEDDQGDKTVVIGFLIAVELPNRDYIWIEQAYNKTGYSAIADEGMVLLKEWAFAAGAVEMRFETSPECPPDFIVHKLAERRGFKPRCMILSARLK